MPILKLKEAGDEATLDIQAVSILEGDHGRQVKFETTTGDLFVPESSVERQLDRCGVADIEQLAGRTIHFSRAANTKNPKFAPYWNLSKATADDIQKRGEAPKTNGKPVSEYETPARLPGESVGFDSLLEKYTECVREAVGLAQRISNAGITVDGSAVSAMAATLFIARKDAKV